MTPRLITAMAALTLLGAASGCTLVADVDRRKIPDEVATGGTPGTGGAVATGGAVGDAAADAADGGPDAGGTGGGGTGGGGTGGVADASADGA